MFNAVFNNFTDVTTDYFPDHLRQEIDAVNQPIYNNINNGVYRCGFARTQSTYEKAFDRLFSELQRLEEKLSMQRYLVGDQITEADWWLFTTLIRFDAVYVGHFKCNLKCIAAYPNLSPCLRELYQVPGIAETVDIDYIKRHYYYSHTSINPAQVVPKGPILNSYLVHDRATKFA